MSSDIVIKNLANVVAGRTAKASAKAKHKKNTKKKFIQFTNFTHVTHTRIHTHMHAGCEMGHTFPVKIIMRGAHRGWGGVGYASCNKSNNYGKRVCHALRLAPLTPFVAQFACFDMSLNLQRCPPHTHTHTHRETSARCHPQATKQSKLPPGTNAALPPFPSFPLLPAALHLSRWQKRPLLGSPIQLPSICMCVCVCCGEGQGEEEG